MLTTKRDGIQCPIQMASAVVMLVAEWLVYALNMATWAFEFWYIDVAGALLACVSVAMAESALGATVKEAWLKGVAVGLIVAIPFPVVGTVLAVAALGWHLVTGLQRRHG